MKKLVGCLWVGAFLILAPWAMAQEEIVEKATDAQMFQMVANLKMTPDQISAVRPIVTDNIVKVRGLQQSLENGDIDSKTMYNQRQKLIEDEYVALGHILTPDQLKTWTNIEDNAS